MRGTDRALGEETQGISRNTAAIGYTGFQRAIGLLIRREIYDADTLEEAMDWLAEQARN